ncbi:MAG: hypothetical protein NC253_05845 [Ruminococcus sp.]|nr:hypothetical protein [Ruminococcus sp.]MCM1382471.1 hypothetical protein [Muribaculaceae bacterium]MCM1479747.1 hypothetical protein [Muribaculaceae bacterium]
MKKFIHICLIILTILATFTACGNNAETVTETSAKISETTTVTTEETVPPPEISDSEVVELYNRAYKTVLGKEFYRNENGKLLTENGKTFEEYKAEFCQLFTDEYAEKYFKLAKGGTYFRGDSQFLEIFVLQEENTVDSIDDFNGFSGVWVGLGDRGSDLSVMDSKMEVTYKSRDKITLTVTVWHSLPDRELTVGEDYLYRLENGSLVIAGKFGGVDENGNYITLDDELSGTVADVPVSGDKTEFYGKKYENYLVKYDFVLLPDEGVWKFDSFYIWD